MDERPISQRLKRRDGSKPPPSYSGHDGDEESSDEDVGGESVACVEEILVQWIENVGSVDRPKSSCGWILGGWIIMPVD